MGLARAQALLRSVREESDSILVGVSGGKDSLVVLDLCCALFPRVEGYCMRILDVRCATADAELAARRHRIPLHVVPHFDTPRLIKHAVFRFHRNDADNVRELKLKDIESDLRSKTGIDWLATGERMTDSAARRIMMTENGGINHKSRHVYPIADWLDRDVFSYLRAKRIPLPERWGRVLTQGGTGFTLTPAVLRHVRAKYPDDYERIRQAFPFAESLIKREEFQAAQGAAVPGREDSSEPDQERAVQSQDH
jgi:phosphoadenosine phosphosulfate reductase